MDRQHIRMHDRRGRLGLAGEPLFRQRALGQMRRQHFDRHAAFQLAIERLEHDAHAAAADDFQHIVAAQSAEHVRFVGGLQMLDREIDLRPILVRRHGGIEFIFGRAAPPLRGTMSARRPFAPALRCIVALFEMPLQRCFIVLRKFPANADSRIAANNDCSC